MFVLLDINTTGASRGVGIAYPLEALEFTTVSVGFMLPCH